MTPADVTQGVFETLLVRDGRVQALDAHLERLTASLSQLYGVGLPGAVRREIRRHADPLAAEHRLRVDVVPTDGDPRVTVRTTPLHPGRPRQFQCAPVVVAGAIGAHKWRDRQRLAELVAPGTTPLLVDRDGHVLEAAWASFWLLDRDAIVTPPVDGRILPGVTRARLLALARSLQLVAVQRPITVAAARAAPAAFLTSSLQLAAAAALPDAQPPSRDALARIDRIRDALGAGDWS